VELAPFAAGIDGRWKIGEKRVIEYTVSKRTVELRGVHAHQPGNESLLDESSGELGGVEPPDWKQGFETRRREQSLTVGADVGQKEIAERYCRPVFLN